MILADKLNYGDKIGIIAPSNPLNEKTKVMLNNGIEQIKKMGFDVEVSKNIFSRSMGYGASPQEKADDIHEMFADRSIKAVMCAQGGNMSNSVLSYIDWGLIRSNPKILMGISDITVLLNAFYKKTGLVTFHGNDVVWSFGRNPTDYDRSEFKERLVECNKVIKPSYKSRRTIIEGEASGKIIGGNLRCFLKLAGTEYMPDIDNSIMIIEGMTYEPDLIDSLMTHMMHLGIFDKVNGIIIGYIEGVDNKEGTVKYEEIIKSKIRRNIPIIKAEDFGHNTPNTVIPIGSEVYINSVTKEIKILEEFLNNTTFALQNAL